MLTLIVVSMHDALGCGGCAHDGGVNFWDFEEHRFGCTKPFDAKVFV